MDEMNQDFGTAFDYFDYYLGEDQGKAIYV